MEPSTIPATENRADPRFFEPSTRRYHPWPIEWILFLFPITFLTHITANLIGYITGIQDDPL